MDESVGSESRTIWQVVLGWRDSFDLVVDHYFIQRTFMLGNNFDYRLMFLVLIVPQLMEWMHSGDKKVSFIAIVCLVAVYFSCWHFLAWYAPYFDSSHDRLKALFIFDETINWLLMAGLAYLLAASTPAWLKHQVASILPKRRVVSSILS